jgi:hypothetical protein
MPDLDAASRFPDHGEDRGLPGTCIEVQSAGLQVYAISFVGDFLDLIEEPPFTALEICEW